jgi:hypothetical protein
VSSAFLKLGLMSFGGPGAHLGYLHEEFVSKRRWLDDATFGLLQWWKAPPWLVVILAVTTGQWGLR